LPAWGKRLTQAWIRLRHVSDPIAATKQLGLAAAISTAASVLSMKKTWRSLCANCRGRQYRRTMCRPDDRAPSNASEPEADRISLADEQYPRPETAMIRSRYGFFE